MLLVGAWWPARPDAPAAGISYWRQAGEVNRQEASNLQNARSLLAVNRGQSSDDLLERYWGCGQVSSVRPLWPVRPSTMCT